MLNYIQERLRSFGYAFAGLAEVVRSQPNAKIHIIGLIASILLGAICGLSTIEWAIVVLCCGTVLAAEAMNTALENVVDLVSPDYHLLAGKAKDAAAAAVLITAMMAVIIGVIIFLPKIKAIL